ncbi:hypothetical protein ACW7EJ_19745, partial [Acinetobacter soli]
TTGEKLADLQDKKNEEISNKEDVTVVEDAIQERGKAAFRSYEVTIPFDIRMMKSSLTYVTINQLKQSR